MNPFALFRELLGAPRLQIGTVLGVADGTATIELPSGGQIQARGAASVGSKVFVRNGVIEGSAPNLPSYDIEV
jgi:hypothetical protein